MAITLTPETEAKLRETASREGQDADALADSMLAEVLAQRAQEFEEDIAAVQEGLDAIDQGRVRPFKDYMAEHRQRFPSMTTA